MRKTVGVADKPLLIQALAYVEGYQRYRPLSEIGVDKGDARELDVMIKDSIAPGAKGLLMTSAKLARLQGVITIINFELAVSTPSLETGAPQKEDITSMSELKPAAMDIERAGPTLVSINGIGVEKELFAAKSWSEFSRSLDMEIPTL